MIHWLMREWFLAGMIGAVVLASLFPDLGRSGGTLHMETLTDVGIVLVFFLHGMGLSFDSLKRGLMSWRVHLVIQSLTFILFPLLWVIFEPVLSPWISPGLMS